MTATTKSERHQCDVSFDVVYADTLRYFPDLVRELGGDPERLLREAGIDPCALAEGQSSVGYRAIATLLEHTAEALKCPDLGMRLARRQGGAVFGLLGEVMRNSITFGEGLDYVAKHCQAHSLAARVRLDRDRKHQRLFAAHEILVDRLTNKRQAIEQVLLLGHLNAQETTGGRARVREVSFRYQPLSSIKTYRRYFGCDVRFDQWEDGVMFFDRDLDCPIVAPDAQAYAAATSRIDARFSRNKPPMRAQVRAIIVQFIGTAKCSKEGVAAQLSLHPRTLHRRLRAEGSSFEQVKDQVRRDLALSYLHVTALPLQRIAEKLGYAEHSVLTRSCSRWFDATPRELRARAS